MKSIIINPIDATKNIVHILPWNMILEPNKRWKSKIDTILEYYLIADDNLFEGL